MRLGCSGVNLDDAGSADPVSSPARMDSTHRPVFGDRRERQRFGKCVFPQENKKGPGEVQGGPDHTVGEVIAVTLYISHRIKEKSIKEIVMDVLAWVI